MDDREIIQWDKRLTDQARQGWENYKHLHIDLGVARVNQSYLIAGEYLYAENSSSDDAIAKIVLNRVNNDALDLEQGVKIETVFIEIFVTNDALADEWIDLVFGINFKYKKKVEGGGGLIGESYVDVYRSIPQVIASATLTVVNFDTEITDRNDEFDLATDLFTTKNAGDYLVIVHAKLDQIDAKMGIYPHLNGVMQQEINFVAPVLQPNSIGGVGALIMILSPGDTLDMRVWHNCVGNKNLEGGITKNRLQIYRLR